MGEINKYSITSNEAKLYKHFDRLSLLRNGIVRPIMLVVSPTNKCNLQCSHCCFDGRDKKLELDFDYLKNSLRQFYQLWIKSVELTGGGEPTLYKPINELIVFVTDELKLDLGMNTNCVSLSNVKDDNLKKFAWIRASLNFLDRDDNNSSDKYVKKITENILKAKESTSLTACYIVPQKTRTKYLDKVIEFAETNKIYTRIAPDCIQSKDGILDLIEEIKPFVVNSEYCFVSDFNVYLQSRVDNFCSMHVVKPILFTDGWVYVCPSSELSEENTKDVSEKFRVCRGDEAMEYYIKGKFETFEHACNYCKYARQNEILKNILIETTFNNFV